MNFRLLFLGDIVGRPGRKAVASQMKTLREQFSPHVVIANGENASGGFGIQPETADEIFKSGVDFITTGNHVWAKREINDYLDRYSARILRPANFAGSAPGAGHLIHRHESGLSLVIMNLIGRVFMPDLVDCPFQKAASILNELSAQHPEAIIFCDFHAEATSEKVALGHFLDGKVSAVVGTHTHIQTADDHILPEGTAYLSDAGMCGPEDGVLGCEKQPIVEKFLTGRPHRFDVAKGPTIVNGVVIDIDSETRKAVHIERVYLRVRSV